MNAAASIVLTGRECHRVDIDTDENGDPCAARCNCGARWCELTDPPATEWAHVHVAPAPVVRSIATRHASYCYDEDGKLECACGLDIVDAQLVEELAARYVARDAAL